jgi:5-deoxy-glucuronate isomerase
MKLEAISPETCVVRDTGAQKGRRHFVAPGATASRQLRYGRIILDSTDAPLRFGTDEFEIGLIALAGSASVRVGESANVLERYDALYVPRDSSVEVHAGSGGCDLAEVAAPVTKRHPLQVVRFADVQSNPGLHFQAGGAAAKRDLNVLIGKNVQASRIMAGVTFSEPGNWTSWPPHEHASMLEEAYLYIDMPAPSFGVQLVYTDAREPELARLEDRTDRPRTCSRTRREALPVPQRGVSGVTERQRPGGCGRAEKGLRRLEVPRRLGGGNVRARRPEDSEAG